MTNEAWRGKTERMRLNRNSHERTHPSTLHHPICTLEPKPGAIHRPIRKYEPKPGAVHHPIRKYEPKPGAVHRPIYKYEPKPAPQQASPTTEPTPPNRIPLFFGI